MINLSDKPIVYNDFNIRRLLRQTEVALGSVEQEVGWHPDRTGRHKLARAENVCDAISIKSDPLAVVRSLCEIAGGKARVDDQIAERSRILEFTPTSNNRNNIRSFCRRVLYFAWCDRGVLLPANFKMARSVSEEMRVESPSPVLATLARYIPQDDEIKRFGNHIQQWMTQYSLSWVYCTDWVDFTDIDFAEAADLHVFMSDYNRVKKGNPSSVEKAMLVFSERGLTEFEADRYYAHKEVSYHKLSQKRLASKDANAFIRPRNRLKGSFFYILPQLQVDGFSPSAEVLQTWDRLFASYISSREQTGRTATRAPITALHALADYIAIALPTFSMHSTEKIEVPASPKEFTRYPYIDQALQELPFPTFLEFLKRRGHSDATRQSHLYTILYFFQWIERNAATEGFKKIAGPDFRCPLYGEDFPFVPRPTGTNKTPFEKHVYPLLLHYMHEVEKIGMYLEVQPQVAASIGRLTEQPSNHVIFLRSNDIEFKFLYQNDTYVINQIPQRLIVGRNRASRGINLSTFRLLCLIMETGLRGQNAQWLDKDEWAKYFQEFQPDDPVKRIHVNTDKTGTTLDIPVYARVWDILQRQQDHRSAKNIPEIMINYESRANSPFKPLVPLFANEDGSVISDSAYASVWSDLMMSFQGFLYENDVEFRPITKVKPPKVFDAGRSKAEGPICELNWSPVHTPHSARSSYVTRRAGSTDYFVLAEQIGHRDPVMTAYYHMVELADMTGRLPHENRPALDTTSPMSELRTQLTLFEHDKEKVIQSFGITSLRDVHESETSGDDTKGIELLKASQTSELVFRDTHICVVGEMCPDDVILAAGAPMRCGTCKLACKSVDHLPAIEAKCRALIGRIKVTSSALQREKTEGGDKARQNRLHNDLTVDSYQLVGWQDASAVLQRLLEQKKSQGYVAGSPDIIKLHLERVVRQVEPAQFLADRILDAKMYSSMSDEVLEAQASRLARKLALREVELTADKNEEVMMLYSYITTRLQAIGKTWGEAGKIIEQEVGELIGNKSSELTLIDASS